MSSRFTILLRHLLNECSISVNFNTLLEAVLTEGVSLQDWETNARWGADENGKNAGPQEVTLEANDFVNMASPGVSISRSGYLFLPSGFAMSRSDGSKILKHISASIRMNGKVTFGTYPGYGVETDSFQAAYPALMFKHFTHEEKVAAEDQVGRGRIIFSMDGQPLSELLTMSAPREVADAPDESRSILDIFLNPGGRPKPEGGEIPEWLHELLGAVDQATKAGSVTQSLAKARGFEYNLVLTSPESDSVLVLSRDMARAAYIFKKQMYMEKGGEGPQPSDWDAVVNNKMKEFTLAYKRRPRGTKGENIPAPNLSDAPQPKLALRYWMAATENKWSVQQGYALRRDFNSNNIVQLMANGINYTAGIALADRVS